MYRILYERTYKGDLEPVKCSLGAPAYFRHTTHLSYVLPIILLTSDT
jgi:hypothetical protein